MHRRGGELRGRRFAGPRSRGGEAGLIGGLAGLGMGDNADIRAPQPPAWRFILQCRLTFRCFLLICALLRARGPAACAPCCGPAPPPQSTGPDLNEITTATADSTDDAQPDTVPATVPAEAARPTFADLGLSEIRGARGLRYGLPASDADPGAGHPLRADGPRRDGHGTDRHRQDRRLHPAHAGHPVRLPRPRPHAAQPDPGADPRTGAAGGRELRPVRQVPEAEPRADHRR